VLARIQCALARAVWGHAPPPPENFVKFFEIYKFVLAKMCAFITQKALKVTSESINYRLHIHQYRKHDFILLDNQLV